MTTSGVGRVLRNSPYCPFAGVQHEGEPAFRDFIVPGLPGLNRSAYISWAREPHIQEGKGLLLIPDQNGLWHNFRLLADQFAAAGYTTLVVPYNDVVRVEDTLKAAGSADQIAALGDDAAKRDYYTNVVAAGVAHLRSLNCNTMGLLAYCEGGEAVVRELPTGTFAACFLASPKIIELTLLQTTKTPVCIALADEDDGIPPLNTMSAHTVMEQYLQSSAYPYQISLYSHVHMGFAQRRTMQSKAEIFAKRGAFTQAVTFMREHMGTSNV